MTRYRIRTAGLLAAAVSWLGIASAHGAETNGAGAWTAAQRQQGYVVFHHDNLRLLEPSDVPAPDAAAGKTITCSLARGEYEPVQIGIHALAPDIKHVRLAVESDVAVRVFRRIDEKVHKLLDGYSYEFPPFDVSTSEYTSHAHGYTLVRSFRTTRPDAPCSRSSFSGPN